MKQILRVAAILALKVNRKEVKPASHLIFENVVVESIGNISAHDCELQVSVFSESLAQSNIT